MAVMKLLQTSLFLATFVTTAGCGGAADRSSGSGGGAATGGGRPATGSGGATGDGGGGAAAPDAFLTLLVGTDGAGKAHNPPAGWDAARMGAWNGKNAAYDPATRRIAFHVQRSDIVGASVALGSPAATPGVTEAFTAGPGASLDPSSTTELYLADADGSDPRCLGCEDVVDGDGDVRIYRVLPSQTGAAGSVERQKGAKIFANRSKQLPTFYPGGAWIIVGIEMARHAGTHAKAGAETAFFDDLWAVSADGATWVELTDFASTWSRSDAGGALPISCALGVSLCPGGCQYAAGAAVTAPFDIYWCSDAGAPPPASGAVRPTLSHELHDGAAYLTWGEQVGQSGSYTWGASWQLATAHVVMTEGSPSVPALVDYHRNLTPTPAHPDSTDGSASHRPLWSNPGGDANIGAGYEPWSFRADDLAINLATDAFFSTSSPSVTHACAPWSEVFVDATSWPFLSLGEPFVDYTEYSAKTYPYEDNGAATAPLEDYGHWEEPILSSLAGAPEVVLFSSSADLPTPWNPSAFDATFGLEIWRLPKGSAAERLTEFNGAKPGSVFDVGWPTSPSDYAPGTGGPHPQAYATAWNTSDGSVYATVVLSKSYQGKDATSRIYRMVLPK